MQKQKRLLSIGEASEYLGVSIDTLRRWEKRGKITSLRSPGNHRYFPIENLDRLFGRKYEHDLPKNKTDKQKEVSEIKTVEIPELIKQNNIQKEIPTPITATTTPTLTFPHPIYEPPVVERIIDRPSREVKIPEVKLIRVVERKEETKISENQIREVKSEEVKESVLTPLTLIKTPIQEAQKEIQTIKVNAPKVPIPQDTKKSVIKNNLTIYAVITITILVVIATIFFFIGASSRGLLSPVP